MAIRTVVTRGYGNGVFNGTVANVVLRGYSIGDGALGSWTLLSPSEATTWSLITPSESTAWTPIAPSETTTWTLLKS